MTERLTELPRLVVAAPGSGHGKTMVTTGLLAALRARGVEVSGHKVGPDYIDPGYHAAATGRVGRNLDPWLVGEERIVPLLLHGALTPRPADVAVIEGVMGLFDGAIGRGGFASAAHVARLTASPVVLVVDAAAASRSVGATVLGFATFDPTVRVAGVILNNVATPRHEAEARDGVAMTGLPVLGVIPRRAEIVVPSRHLGLVPVAERSPEAMAAVAALAELVGEHVDLDAVLEIARTATPLVGEPWSAVTAVAEARAGDIRAAAPSSKPSAPDPAEIRAAAPSSAPSAPDPAEIRAAAPSSTQPPVRVAVAAGPAFSFLYAETVELLEAAGAEVVSLDPLHDDHLPLGTRALYVGGGFPEVHAETLAANATLTSDVRRLVADGGVVVGECAGLLWLGEALDGHRMCGVLPTTASFGARLHLGYREGVAVVDSVLARAGERVTGHEFHRTTVERGDAEPAWVWRAHDGSAHHDGVVAAGVHASYLHVHWAGHPHLATRLVDAARRAAGTPAVVGVGATSRATADDVVAAVRQTVGGARVGRLASGHDVGAAGVLDAAAATLGARLTRLDDATLARMPAPSPSAVVAEHRATASVAEAAVLALGARLTHPKRVVGQVTVAAGTPAADPAPEKAGHAGAALDGAAAEGATLDRAPNEGATLARAVLDGAAPEGSTLARALLDRAAPEGAAS